MYFQPYLHLALALKRLISIEWITFATMVLNVASTTSFWWDKAQVKDKIGYHQRLVYLLPLLDWIRSLIFGFRKLQFVQLPD